MTKPLFCSWHKDVIKLTQRKRQLALEKLELNSDQVIPIFDEATQTVSSTLNFPVAILGLLVDDKYILKSAYGLSSLGLMNELARTRTISKEQAFGSHVIDSSDCLIVNDTLADSFFASSDLCQHYGVRAYLGVPIMSFEGVCIGCLEVIDTQPRQFTSTEINYMVITARWSIAEYERDQIINRSSNYSNNYLYQNSVTSTQELTSELDSFSPSLSTDTEDIIDQNWYLKELTLLLVNQLASKLSIPLTSIVGMSSVLKQEIYGVLNSKQSEYIQIIHDSGQELTALVDEMAQVTTIEHQLNLELMPVDFENLGQQVISSLQPMADSRELSLRLSIEPGKKIWQLDRDKIKKTIYYFLICIIHSSRSGGEINVHISQRGNQLRINCRVNHPWLGEGISLDKVNLYQEVLNYDSYNNFLLRKSLIKIKEKNLQYDLICLLVSAYLANLQKGVIGLNGSVESGYRFILSIPLAENI